MWLNTFVDYLDTAMANSKTSGRRLRRTEAGQSMVEYAIVAALIAIVAMAAVEALGGGIAQVFDNILSSIDGIGS
jgi:Flp pilus assembly pilin Flp